MPIYRVRRVEILVLEIQAENGASAAQTAHDNYSWEVGRSILSKEVLHLDLGVAYLRADPPVESTPEPESAPAIEVPAPAPDSKEIPF